MTEWLEGDHSIGCRAISTECNWKSEK